MQLNVRLSVHKENIKLKHKVNLYWGYIVTYNVYNDVNAQIFSKSLKYIILRTKNVLEIVHVLQTLTAVYIDSHRDMRTQRDSFRLLVCTYYYNTNL